MVKFLLKIIGYGLLFSVWIFCAIIPFYSNGFDISKTYNFLIYLLYHVFIIFCYYIVYINFFDKEGE